MRYPKALRLCLENVRPDPARFYGPPDGLPLGAGVILRDCVMAFPHLSETRFETAVGLALVLTHECDVDQANERHFNGLLLVCPIIPLDNFCEELEEQEGAGAWGGILEQIARDSVYRAMYIPPVRNFGECPELEGGGILYLNHISSVRVEWIKDPGGQAICSLSAIGLRAFDFKLRGHLLREKATQLWFYR